MTTRLNKLILFVGERGTGKTTLARALAEKAGKRSIVVDTDFHPSYNDVCVITAEQARTHTTGNIRLVESDIDNVLDILNRHQTNAFIFLEDAAKYIGSKLTKKQIAFIIDMRKRNFDVIIMFHCLSDIPPYLCKNYDTLVIFKVGDNLDVPQNKFNNWEAVRTTALRVKKNKHFNYCEVIDKK